MAAGINVVKKEALANIAIMIPTKGSAVDWMDLPVMVIVLHLHLNTFPLEVMYVSIKIHVCIKNLNLTRNLAKKAFEASLVI